MLLQHLNQRRKNWQTLNCFVAQWLDSSSLNRKLPVYFLSVWARFWNILDWLKGPWVYMKDSSNRKMSHHVQKLIIPILMRCALFSLFCVWHNISFRPQQVWSHWTMWASMAVGEPSLSMQGSLPPPSLCPSHYLPALFFPFTLLLSFFSAINIQVMIFLFFTFLNHN